MINVENVKLPFDEDGETAIITLSKYSYDALIRKSAQLEAIKNMALQKEVLDGDAVLAVCGAVKESDWRMVFQRTSWKQQLKDTQMSARDKRPSRSISNIPITEVTFDAIDEKVKEVAIGKTGNEYFNGLSDAATRIDTAIRPDGTVIGQQIQGIIDMAAAQMKLLSTKAKKQNVRAILYEDKDPESPLYGAMCLGTQGFQIANKRTADGRDWDWSTFGNANGFFADLIVAGTMLADRIRGGELISMEYEEGEKGFKLDLNKGIMKAVQLLIETKKKGRMEKGFRFKDGNLEILGIDDKVVASIHCCGSLPDNPNDLPSGWPDKVVFAGGESSENYMDGFWVEGEKAAGVRCNELEVHSDNDMEVFIGGNIEAEIRKKVIINKKETKTGRAEFSDGTYLEFVNGYLVGGNAKAGGF